uniref:Phosphoadenosine 5'-phosphosulfate reductase n=1 Tax=Thiocapsa roseopersicina TaxID=1058 RepID=CYSH_THIRO|nr:RecName: Full=Phosphoadenosine 5'-phosphosulfate reductase; Short=PAPS reductase; AltName: Full=3'-phosphoadenylylsulfate reductase; AltName: Full=PAPS reductase, thioredoxin dependent; AltName: Full=PAPS sulfotransferase; AltName: Full=PAdoPS reductase [Thiocapsa roseopersicina]CAA80690.1 PAPS-reductase [Thiocapsa roseopersicina]
MSKPDLDAFLHGDDAALRETNRRLESMPAEDRVRWALEHLPPQHVLSSSFGTQSAVMLHLVSRQMPEIPVILVDTGYLFPETYRLVDALTDRFGLNLKVYRPALSPAWQEAGLGRLWEQGADGIERYNRLNKIDPMERALRDLDAGTWFAGLRRQQANSRAELPVLRRQDGRIKFHPIIDWHRPRRARYLRRHDLPDHPLRDQGYVSIGDVHTTVPLLPGMLEEETRFFGIKRECGLHR